MLDVVTGQRKSVVQTSALRDALLQLAPNGTLYIGYPILATPDTPIVFEALLTCEEYGVVIFALQHSPETQDAIEDRENEFYAALFQKLLSFKPLRKGRELAVNIEVVTIAPTSVGQTGSDRTVSCDPSALRKRLGSFTPISKDQLRFVDAAIQRLTTIKPANKRQTVTSPHSRGARMREIEKEIANLDQWQKKAAIESPDAPQRIRGLAGSGKTVVLALKAAYLHAQHPDWDIAVTFHTRSLTQQFVDLIRRFCFEHLNDEPDWSRLRIMHSWGSHGTPGIYSEIAARNGQQVRDFMSARTNFGYDNAFEGACNELLSSLRTKSSPMRLFDAVLIDEAQDLPQPFFELVALSMKDELRIVWAYDELQNLGAYSMMPPAQLFGASASGKPRVPDLAESPGEAKRDITLPVCYRNTPWALTTAHALGFGMYRQPGGIVQYFDDPRLWTDVGYGVVSGELEYGREVVLQRKRESYPEYFNNLLERDDAVACRVFASTVEQAEWVASQVAKNLSEDELEHSDVLIVLPNPLTARDEAATVIDALGRYEISAHLAGVTASRDQLFQDKSVAISGIYRAKGNEAAMVYILNSEFCREGFDIAKKRNILFTAITRSRAWVRILGVGQEMELLAKEVASVRSNDFRLRFRVPTEQELQRIKRIQRDVPEQHRPKLRKAERSLGELVELLQSGELEPEQLPQDLLQKLSRLTRTTDDS